MKKKSVKNLATESLQRTIKRLNSEISEDGLLGITYSGEALRETGYKTPSLYTASELLWAISVCKDIDVGGSLAKNIREKIFDTLQKIMEKQLKNDRLFEDAFILWGLSSGNIAPISNPVYTMLSERVISKQRIDGSWGTYSSKERPITGSVRGTSLAIIALTEYVRIMGKDTTTNNGIPIQSYIKKGIEWLFSEFNDEYLWDSDRKHDGISQDKYIDHFEIRVERNALIVYSIIHSVNNECFELKSEYLKKIDITLDTLNKIDLKMAPFVAEVEDELYINENGEERQHPHGAGGLEFYILMILELRKSKIKGHYFLYISLDKAIEQFLKFERNGAWKDKNTNNVARWTTAYAIRVLSEIKNPLVSVIEMKCYLISQILKFIVRFVKILINPITIMVIFLSIIILLYKLNVKMPEYLLNIGYIAGFLSLPLEVVIKLRNREK